MAVPLFGGPQTPQGQGPQGYRGRNQTPTPQVQNQDRGYFWTPAPASRPVSRQSSGGMNQNFQVLSGAGKSDQPPPPTGGSPVQPNGTIAPPTPVDHRTYTAPNQTWDDPARTQFFAQLRPGQPVADRPGWTWQHTGQGWVQQQGAGQGPQPVPPTGAQPQPAHLSPYGPYPGRPEGTVYQPGQLPPVNLTGYQQTPFQQFQQPDFERDELAQQMALQRVMQGIDVPGMEGIQGQQLGNLRNMLGNPSLSDATIAQMKESQKEAALQMQKDMLERLQQSAAGKSMSQSGIAGAQERRLSEATMEDIMGSYRDIDIRAAQQRRADELAALQASEQVLTGQTGRAGQVQQSRLAGLDALEQAMQGRAGRATSFYGAGLAGQQAQAEDRARGFEADLAAQGFLRDSAMGQEEMKRAGAESGRQAYQTDLDAFYNWLDSQRQGRQLDIQRELGQGGLDIDRQRIGSTERMFGREQELNWARLLNDMAMGRYGLGLDYAQLQQGSQNQALQSLFGLLGNR